MSNFVKNVAVVGAGGYSGSHIARALLASGKHTVTAVTRADSKSQPPEGCKIVTVDYNDHASLVSSLKGQEVLVITLAINAADQQKKLIDAAVEAEVRYIMPNDWSPDITAKGIRDDVSAFAALQTTRDYIKDTGKSSYIIQTNGFWYEYSLAFPAAFGFDFKKKEATFFNDGDNKLCLSTLPRTGIAVAAFLSLPIKSDSGLSIEQFRNQTYQVNSFAVSQKDMFESILRVTGDKADDWKITKEPARQRVADGQKELQSGVHVGYIKIMYGRIFYDDSNSDYSKSSRFINTQLGLPQDDLDKATKVGIERALESKW